MSTLRVNTLQNTSTTDGGISINNSGHITMDGVPYPSAGPLSNRNLIINGAMQVAQRGTSHATSGYGSLDRWVLAFGGISATMSQQSLSSGDPYNEGFRNFLRLANTGTSTSTTSFIQSSHRVEATNVATSGWNYTNSSSFLVSSFWVRSSLAGTYYVQYRAPDAGSYYFNRSFTLAADTWTKVTHTIPGDSSVVVSNDTGIGLELVIVPHYGTGYQGANATDGSWFTLTSDDYFPSSTYSQNWANTASATFDITGVQLEVGTVATPFEHRSYGEELARCQRYFLALNLTGVHLSGANTTRANGSAFFPVEMRDNPTLTSSSVNRMTNFGVSDYSGTYTFGVEHAKKTHAAISYTRSSGSTWSAGLPLCINDTGGSTLMNATAEL